MKKGFLFLAIFVSISFMSVFAEEAELDMSNPTDIYTTLGLAYGNEGVDFKSMLMLSNTETRKTGIIFNVNDVFSQESDVNYRFRAGSINTVNGLGFSVDAVNFEHPFFERTTVVQTGPNCTIPIGDKFIMFPVVYVGAVIAKDNTEDVLPMAAASATASAMTDAGIYTPAQIAAASASAAADATALYNGSENYLSGGGYTIASTIMTGMVYARYAITDRLWTLGSFAFTKDIQGKSWNDDVVDGGLQLPSAKYDISLGFQITPTQNIVAKYEGNSEETALDDGKYSLAYNYAF